MNFYFLTSVLTINFLPLLFAKFFYGNIFTVIILNAPGAKKSLKKESIPLSFNKTTSNFIFSADHLVMRP